MPCPQLSLRCQRQCLGMCVAWVSGWQYAATMKAQTVVNVGSTLKGSSSLCRYTLQDLREYGRKKSWCPYFLARHMLAFANVIVYNYQYMLDPKVRVNGFSLEGSCRFTCTDMLPELIGLAHSGRFSNILVACRCPTWYHVSLRRNVWWSLTKLTT